MYMLNVRPPTPLEKRFMKILLTVDKNFIREWEFCPNRTWRSDFAYPQYKLLIEVEGGTWLKGKGHVSGKIYSDNCWKYNEASLMGWVLLRYTTDMIRDHKDAIKAQVAAAIAKAKGLPYYQELFA